MSGYHPRGQWQRVARDRPCPICARFKWCSTSSDGHLAICMRVSEGAIRRTRNGGFLHSLKPLEPRQRLQRTSIVRTSRAPSDTNQWLQCCERFQAAVNPERLNRLAIALGVSVASLMRLRIGWSVARNAWSFPMVDANGAVVGMRLRTPGGRKFAETGGHEGLFIPLDLAIGNEPVAICEGPTDTAALLDLGFACVGRPSCSGGIGLVAELVRVHAPPGVFVFADNDPAGLRGAEALASTLVAYAGDVRLVRPPPGIKDVRAWLQSGATRESVLHGINATPPRRLKIVSERARDDGSRRRARDGQ